MSSFPIQHRDSTNFDVQEVMTFPPVNLSLVIPSFNEARRLPESLERLVRCGAMLATSFEIIVVVERSTDGTADIATHIADREPTVVVVANNVRRGKGYAIRTGVQRARGEIIFTMDADLSVPPEAIEEFLRYLDRHPEVDVLVGNRQHRESEIAVRQHFVRELMGKCFNVMLRAANVGSLRDTQCGFKAFRRPAAMEIFSRQTIDGFACDVEILLLARGLGFTTHDHPVRWVNSPESKVRLLRDSTRMLLDIATVRNRVDAALKKAPPRSNEQ